MPSPPHGGQRRPVTKCYGRLASDQVYTPAGVMRAIGLGAESLAKARRSKIVRPIFEGRRVYYLGSEIIAYLRWRRDGNHAEEVQP